MRIADYATGPRRDTAGVSSSQATSAERLPSAAFFKSDAMAGWRLSWMSVGRNRRIMRVKFALCSIYHLLPLCQSPGRLCGWIEAIPVPSYNRPKRGMFELLDAYPGLSTYDFARGLS